MDIGFQQLAVKGFVAFHHASEKEPSLHLRENTRAGCQRAQAMKKLKDDFTRPGSGRSTTRESRAGKRDLPAELYTNEKPKVLAKSMILDGVRFDWPFTVQPSVTETRRDSTETRSIPLLVRSGKSN